MLSKDYNSSGTTTTTTTDGALHDSERLSTNKQRRRRKRNRKVGLQELVVEVGVESLIAKDSLLGAINRDIRDS